MVETMRMEGHTALVHTAGDILATMEAVGSKEATGFNTYGSVDNKQVYIYGGLDFSPTLLNRAFGMTWSGSV
jgi:hypothetical protein